MSNLQAMPMALSLIMKRHNVTLFFGLLTQMCLKVDRNFTKGRQFLCKTSMVCSLSAWPREVFLMPDRVWISNSHTEWTCLRRVGRKQAVLILNAPNVCADTVEMANLSFGLLRTAIFGQVTRSKAERDIGRLKHWKHTDVKSDPGLFSHTHPSVIRLCSVNKGLAGQPHFFHSARSGSNQRCLGVNFRVCMFSAKAVLRFKVVTFAFQMFTFLLTDVAVSKDISSCVIRWCGYFNFCRVSCQPSEPHVQS